MPVDQAPPPAPRPAARPAKDAGKLVRYHDYIDEKIESTRRMVKFVDFATAFMELTVGLIAFLLVYALVEHWVVPSGFSFGMRCALFTAVIIGVGVFVVRRLWPLCVNAINPVYAAQTIEHGSPTLKNGLINLLLFRERRTEIPDAVYRTLEEQAAHGLTRVPVDTAVDRTQLIRLGYVLIGIVAIGAIYKVLSPKDPFIAAERVLMPWADLVPASRVSISAVAPGVVTISRGEYVDVSAEVRGLAEDESVVLRYTTDDGQIKGRAIPLKTDSDRIKFSGRLADDAAGLGSIGLTRSSTYWLEAGDARSLDYEVTVVPAASILVERVEYDYPTYTGFVDRTVEGIGDINAIEGTKVTVHARANGIIQTANVDFDADGRRDLTMTAKEMQAHISFEVGVREDRITPKHASYVLRFTNEEGRTNHDPVKHSINVEIDRDPEVGIRAPQEDARDARLDEAVAIECEAIDPDFMLSAVRLRGQVSGRDSLDEKLLKAEHRGKFTAIYKLTPKAAGLKVGDVVEYWVEASDNRTPKPNTVVTKHKTLRIVSSNLGQQPPPDQLAQNDRQRQQQDQQQGNQGKQGQKDGNSGQQKGNDGGEGQAQQGQGQQGQGQQGQGQQGQGKGEGQKNEGQNEQSGGQGNQQQGGAGGKSQPDGAAQKAEGNEQENQQNNNEQQPGGQNQQGGNQSKSGDSKGQKNEGDQQQNAGGEQNGAANQQGQGGQQSGGARDQAGEKNADQNSKQQPSGEKSDGQQQPQGEQNQGADQSPVSSEGDNDAEAFDRIQKHLEQNGELKKDESASGEQKEGDQSQDNQQGQKQGEQNQGSQQQGGKQQGEQSQGEKETGKQNGAKGQQQPQNGQGDKQQGNQQEKGGEQQNGQQQKEGQGSQQGAQDQKNTGEQQKDGQQQGGQQKNEQGQGGAQSRQDDLKKGEKPGDQQQGQEKSPGGEQTSSKGDPGGGKEQDPQGSPNSKEGMKPTEKPEQKPSQGDQSNKTEPPAGAKGKKESDSHGEQGGDKAGGGEEGGGQKSQRDGTGSAGQNQSADNGAGQSGEKGKGENSSEGGQDAKSSEKTGSSDGKTQGQGSQQRDGAGDKQGGEKGTQSGDQNSAGQQKAGGQQKPAGKEGQSKGEDKEQGKQGDKEQGGEQGQQGDKQGQNQQAGKQGEKQNGQQGEQQQAKQGEKPGEQAGDKQQNQEPGKESNKGEEGADNSAASGGSAEGGGRPGSIAQPNHGGETPEGEAANLEYARKHTDLVVDKLADQLKKKKVDDKMLKELGWTEAELRRFVERWQQRRDAANANDPSAEAAKKELDDALRSLGLQRDKLQQNAVQKDTMRDLQQGYRGTVPAEYKDRLRAYNQGVSRARQSSE